MQIDDFCYLGSAVHTDRKIEEDVAHIIKASLLEW